MRQVLAVGPYGSRKPQRVTGATRIRSTPTDDWDDGTRFQLVGIAADVKNDGLARPTVPEIHIPAFYTRVEKIRFTDIL